MSLQSSLNNDALSQLPLVYDCISKAPQFEAVQMTSKALRVLLQSSICLDDMNDVQKSELDKSLISSFKYFGWMK